MVAARQGGGDVQEELLAFHAWRSVVRPDAAVRGCLRRHVSRYAARSAELPFSKASIKISRSRITSHLPLDPKASL